MKWSTNGIFVLGQLFALFVCLVAPRGARAQSTTDGAIGGTVVDSNSITNLALTSRKPRKTPNQSIA